MEVQGNEPPRDLPCFDVDGMLGRLAKWLRILGFDAEFPRSSPIEGRYFVTAGAVVGRTNVVTVTAERPLEQLKQVIAQTGISVEPDRRFSRCLVCNLPVVEVSKELLDGRVPPEIFASRSEFHECPGCRRVYWEGSHLERTKKRLADMGII
jgi:uncharacterized protein